MKNFMLIPEDVPRSQFVLFAENGTKVRDTYVDLRCSQCGKIDEFAALDRGVAEGIVFPKKMPDFFSSNEDLDIVSENMRRFLDSLDKVKVRYFPFPSDSRFFVAFPDEMIPVTADNKAFRVEGGWCPVCNRARECVIGSELHPLRSDFVLGALLFETVANVSPMWIVCEKVVDSLKQAKLKGLEFHPYFKIA